VVHSRRVVKRVSGVTDPMVATGQYAGGGWVGGTYDEACMNHIGLGGTNRWWVGGCGCLTLFRRHARLQNAAVHE
jgi:hypothetical protein